MAFAIIAVIIFIALTVIMSIMRSSRVRGAKGEARVRLALMLSGVKGTQYTLNDYMIDNGERTAQIDHIVINKNGVFVIETKNHSGYIYGNDSQQRWKQVLSYGKVKNEFYNPVKQNATHVYLLSKLLPSVTVTSIVVFPKANITNVDSEYVTDLTGFTARIHKNSEEELTAELMEECYKTLMASRSTVSKKEHIKSIDKMLSDIEDNICPRCGKKLIERNGKYGNFLGCEGYPSCKFKKNK